MAFLCRRGCALWLLGLPVVNCETRNEEAQQKHTKGSGPNSRVYPLYPCAYEDEPYAVDAPMA